VKQKEETSHTKTGFPTERKSNPVNPPHKYAQDFSAGGKTDRSFGPACDVNTIVKHYDATGIDPHIARKSLEQFGYATSTSYEDAARQIAEVNSSFAALPSEERLEHKNDPQKWVESLIKLQESPVDSTNEPIPEVGVSPDRPAEPQPAAPSPDQGSTNDKKDA